MHALAGRTAWTPLSESGAGRRRFQHNATVYTVMNGSTVQYSTRREVQSAASHDAHSIHRAVTTHRSIPGGQSKGDGRPVLLRRPSLVLCYPHLEFHCGSCYRAVTSWPILYRTALHCTALPCTVSHLSLSAHAQGGVLYSKRSCQVTVAPVQYMYEVRSIGVRHRSGSACHSCASLCSP